LGNKGRETMLSRYSLRDFKGIECMYYSNKKELLAIKRGIEKFECNYYL
jgi:hypothetical protein